MRKVIVSAAVVAILAGIVSFVGTARGQAPKSNSELAHKVGLIDMAYVFKEYEKFTMLRTELQEEIKQSDQQARAKAEQIKKLQEELNSGTLKDNSPEYRAQEKQLAKAASEFEAFRKVAQRDFLRRESQIYKTIYLEVTDAVRKYADYYKYTLIIRFNREGLETAENPQDVIKSMNRQVVYHRSEDDITESVLDFLNREYKKSAGAKPARAAGRNRPNGARRN